MKKISLYGFAFDVDEEKMKECQYLMNVELHAVTIADGIMQAYNAYDSLSGVVKNLMKVKDSFYHKAAEYFVEALRKEKVIGWDYSDEDFLNDSYEASHKLEDIYQNIVDSYNKLTNDKIIAETQRDIRKSSRSKLRGGGTTLTAALEAQAIAGTFNLLTGAAHSVFNLFDGLITNSSINSQMDDIYRKCRPLVRKAIMLDIHNMMIFYFNMLNFNRYYTDERTIKGAYNIKKAIDNGKVPKDEISEQVVEVLMRVPYLEEIYTWAFNLLGNSNGELEQCAKFFGQEKIAEQINYLVKGKSLFGKDFSTVDEKYKNNDFYSLLIENPSVPLEESARKMYSIGSKKTERLNQHLFFKGSVDFNKFVEHLQAILKRYDYSIDSQENCFMLFVDQKDNMLAFTEKNIYTSNTNKLAFNYRDVNYFYMSSDDCKINTFQLFNIVCDRSTAYVVGDIVQILLLKKKYGLGTFINEPQSESDREFNSALIGILSQIKQNPEFKISHVYFYSDDYFVQKKFNGAMSSYAKLKKNEIPLICYDATLLGKADDGFLITSRGIYLHNSYDKTVFYKFQDINSIELNGLFEKDVYINEIQIFKGGLDNKEVEGLYNLLNTFCSTMKKMYSDISDDDNAEVKSTPDSSELSNYVPARNLVNDDQSQIKPKIESSISTDNRQENVVQILTNWRKVCGYNNIKRIYFYDDEHSKRKFNSALSSYVKLKSNEIPLICYDSTRAESAENGFMITTFGIHLHNLKDDKPTFFRHSNIKDVKLNGTFSKDLYVNDIKLDKADSSDKELDIIHSLMHNLLVTKYLVDSTTNTIYIDGFPLDMKGMSLKEQTDDLHYFGAIYKLQNCFADAPFDSTTTVTTQQKTDSQNITSKPPVVSSSSITSSVKQAISNNDRVSIQDDFDKFVRNNPRLKFQCSIYYYGYSEKGDKKFKAALSSYAKLTDFEIPLICYDSTLFGGAKDGFVFTNKGIHFHSLMSNAKFIPYGTIVAKCTEKDFYVNDNYLDTAVMSENDKKNLLNLVEVLRTLFTSNRRYFENEGFRIDSWKRNYNFSSHVYYLDYKNDKSQKKFKAAIENYGKLKAGELAVLCYDSTTFGSAKDGIIVTTKGIYANDEAKGFFPHSSISNVNLKDKDIWIDRNSSSSLPIVNVGGLSSDERNKFCTLLKKIIDDFH